jgi:hypothetical protein
MLSYLDGRLHVLCRLGEGTALVDSELPEYSPVMKRKN